MFSFYILLGFLVCNIHAFNYVSRNSSSQHWFKIEGKEYFVEESFKGNYLTALHYCNYHKMQLVALESKEENDALLQQLKSTLSSYAEFWSAGSRQANERDWVWMSTGRPINVFDWGTGEPNNEGDEKCISLYYKNYSHGWWNDENCNNEIAVICETRDC
ncbi:unnamed protein product [Diabrotica balteata]|uniref:C-type lectin domain-containing protein n=1 Tax=Diabrotica balteata TaxID=107213 RepID=A0A9N9TA43_DIABA|nr:unnamed protein product [Diabrotica balteata]